MSQVSQTFYTLNNRITKLERIIENMMAGYDPCYTPNNVTYFNVIGEAGDSITDARLKGWEVALIAIDNQYPTNTGFAKDKGSDTIILNTPLTGGETITLFLFQSKDSGTSSGYPYTYPASMP